MRNLLIALVLILTGLTFYSALWFKSELIEEDITARVTQNLADDGANSIGIDVDGRHVTLSGVVYDEAVETAYLETADDTYGALGPIDGLTYQSDTGFVSAIKSEDGVTLRGTVPNEEARALLVSQAQAATSGDVDDQLMISGPVADWQDEASYGLGQMAALTSGTLSVAAGGYALSGTTAGDAAPINGAFADRAGWNAFVSSPIAEQGLSADVGRLNGELAARDTRIGELEGSLTQSEAQIATLTTERDTAGDELAKLRANLTDGQSDAEALRAELETTKAGVSDLEAVVAERDASVVDLNGQIASLTSANTDLDGQVAALNTANTDLTDQIAALNTANTDLEGDVSAANQRTVAATASIAALTATVAEKEATVEDQNGRIVTLEEELAKRQDALGSTDERVIALQANVSDQTASLEDLTAQVQERDTTIADLEGKLGTLETDLSGLNAEIATRGETIDGLSNQVATKDSEAAAFQGQITDLTAVVAARDATIADLSNRPTGGSNAQQCAAQASAAMEGSRINFRTGTATIGDESTELLERLTGIALACVGENLTVEIGGHTDAQGTEAANLELSQARAQAVVGFMSERGVPTSGLRATGFGESQPIADNGTSAGRAENRRISFDWQTR